MCLPASPKGLLAPIRTSLTFLTSEHTEEPPKWPIFVYLGRHSCAQKYFLLPNGRIVPNKCTEDATCGLIYAYSAH